MSGKRTIRMAFPTVDGDCFLSIEAEGKITLDQANDLARRIASRVSAGRLQRAKAMAEERDGEEWGLCSRSNPPSLH